MSLGTEEPDIRLADEVITLANSEGLAFQRMMLSDRWQAEEHRYSIPRFRRPVPEQDIR